MNEPRSAPATTDVRARFAAAARMRTAIEHDIESRSDYVEMSTRLTLVARYFETVGYGGLVLTVLAVLFVGNATKIGIGAVEIPLRVRLSALVFGVMVYGGYAITGWLLRHKRRVGVYGALVTLGVALVNALTRTPTQALPIIVAVVGIAGLVSVWKETE